MKVTKYNYLATVYLFLHYLFGNGESVYIQLEKPKEAWPKWSAAYLALGHINYDLGADLYDFNEGEWPDWLIRCGESFYVIWDAGEFTGV